MNDGVMREKALPASLCVYPDTTQLAPGPVGPSVLGKTGMLARRAEVVAGTKKKYIFFK
jgi:hypothetical protein